MKIVTEKVVYKAKYFEVRKQKVVFPNGRKHVYEVVERRPTVSVFPLNTRYNVYLISQYRHMFGKRILEAVSGHVEENETALAAAKRELKEEAGILAYQWEEVTRIQKSASVIKETSHIFLARDLEEGEANPSEGEDISLLKLSLKEAVAKAMNGEINHAATMIGIFILDRLKREKKL